MDKEAKLVDLEERFSEDGAQANIINEPVVVDLEKSFQGHEDRDDKVGISNPIDGHGGTNQELLKETHTQDFPIESLSNEKILVQVFGLYYQIHSTYPYINLAQY